MRTMKKANKIFYVMIIGRQQMAAIDLPGYSHMIPQGEGSYPGSGGATAERFRVTCLGVNKGELQTAVRTLPGYMQGFNTIDPHDPERHRVRPDSARAGVTAGRLADLAGRSHQYWVTLHDGTELHAMRRSARAGYVDAMAATPNTFAAPGDPATVWRYRRLRADERLRVID
jgi:hypothetical protein